MVSCDYEPVLIVGDLSLGINSDGELIHKTQDQPWQRADEAFEQNLGALLSHEQLRILFQAQSQSLTNKIVFCKCCKPKDL